MLYSAARRFSHFVIPVVALLAVAAGGMLLSHGTVTATHPGTTVLVDGSDATADGGGCGDIANPCNDVQTGVTHAVGGDTVSVAAGTYTTGSQIVISKNLAIVGASAATTIIKPGYDTGSSGDARGWFLVNAGRTFDLSDVTLDGTGNKVYQAIRQRGDGTVSDVVLKEIKFEASGPAYSGVGIAAFGTGPVDVTNSTFSGMGRIGVLYFGTGPSGSDFSGNTYTGKGVGDWLDYALDVSAGIVMTIDSNTISGNRGVASSDGSTSAGILVTTFYGAGTTATITNNDLSDNTTGIAVGYDGSDTSAVTANLNNITGNGTGVDSTAPAVDAECNWWGDAGGPGPVGPGTGDGVSANVDFDPWLQSAAPGFSGHVCAGPGAPAGPVGGIVELVTHDGSAVPVNPGSNDSGGWTSLYALIGIVAAAFVGLVAGGGWFIRKQRHSA